MTETVTCPICGDYDGEVSSVQGHITASGGEHAGRTGGQYEETLLARTGKAEDTNTDSTDSDSDTESPNDPDTAAGEPGESGDETEGPASDETKAEDEAEKGESMVEPREYREQQVADSNTDDKTEVVDGGVPGLDLIDDVPTPYLVAAMVVVVVVAYLLLSDGSDAEIEVEETGTEDTERGGMIA
mgnify:CR=1 FL=1